MEFDIRYFDGKTSKVHYASLNINPLSWNITFQEGGFFRQVYWRVDEIKSSEVFTTNTWTFKYGKAPFQYLECDDPLLIETIKQLDPHSHLFSKLDHGLHGSVLRSIGILMSSIVGIGLLFYFTVLPFLSTSFVNTLSKEFVIDLGETMFDSADEGLLVDSTISNVLQDFVNEMELETEFPIKVYCSNIDEVNAFAMPGGEIIIFRGLLEKLENESQLVALIGHEVSHVENRHGLHSLAQSLAGYFFLSIIAGDINGFGSVLMENAHYFKQQHYSRSLETESDFYGMEVLKRNNLSQNGMVDLFEVMKSGHESYSIPYFTSHPDLEDRIIYISEKIELVKSDNRILNNKWLKIEEILLANPLDSVLLSE